MSYIYVANLKQWRVPIDISGQSETVPKPVLREGQEGHDPGAHSFPKNIIFMPKNCKKKKIYNIKKNYYQINS